MCFFEEQVGLVQNFVAERIALEEQNDQAGGHQSRRLQAHERDLILCSLSYDAKVMPESAISVQMQDQAHVQGMLNVALTRARDEVHVFHTALVESFAFADGRPGAVGDWLRDCATIAVLAA